MRLPLRNVNLRSILRLSAAFFLIAVGLYRIVAGHGYQGHIFLTLINQFGLIILGGLILLGIFERFNKTLFFLFGALVYSIAIDEGVLSLLNGQRVATVVLLFLMGYFFYKVVRVTFLARKDTAERHRRRGDFGVIEAGKLIAKGWVKLAVVNLLWKPTRLPPELLEVLEKNLTK